MDNGSLWYKALEVKNAKNCGIKMIVRYRN